MTYGQVRDAALQLIDQYSVAGAEIAETYNNQADYLQRIPLLINDCMMYIATTTRKIPSAAKLATLDFEEHPHMRVYDAPLDFFQFRGNGLLDLTGEHPVRLPVQAWVTGRQFVVPKDYPEEAVLEYWRLPTMIDDDPPDTLELDNAPEVHRLVPYYVAAHLVMGDDSFRYQALYNEFDARLALLMPQALTAAEPIMDCYDGFTAWEGY